MKTKISLFGIMNLVLCLIAGENSSNGCPPPTRAEKRTHSDFKIDVSNLSQGIYFLNIHQERLDINKKFIKF